MRSVLVGEMATVGMAAGIALAAYGSLTRSPLYGPTRPEANRPSARSDDGLPGEQAGVAGCLSMACERLCEGPDTVALSNRPDLVTARELEVALDAPAGSTSREISERRFISARTVDNHRASVYRKLEVGGREELTVALEPALTIGGPQAP